MSNYRPISLLSITSKILERHIHSLVLKHLNENCPISAAQYGFLKGRSTTGALVTAIDEWHNYLENGYDVCTVFFDLKKAFDSVPHHALLEKLIHLNLNQHLQKWIANYLCQRTQAVIVNGATSSSLPVVSGVPQGSVLGPLLFLLYINGISEVQLSDGTLILFADDILLFRPIRNALDFELLQEDVNALFNWVCSNFLCFNAKKCKQMLVSRKRNQTSIVPIKIGGVALEVVSKYSYLGIWITSSLSWNRHVEKCVKELIGK